MKLYNTDQIKAWDQTTLRDKNISSLELMEIAANVFSKRFIELFDVTSPISVFCGCGNNGGDGLAIARILNMRGYEVQVWLADFGQSKSPDFIANLQRLPAFGHIPLFSIDMKEPPTLQPDAIIIDALLGTGINRPVEGPMEDLIHWLNSLNHKIIAVDIPSGLYGDRHCDCAIHAHHTLPSRYLKSVFYCHLMNNIPGRGKSQILAWYLHSIYILKRTTI